MKDISNNNANWQGRQPGTPNHLKLQDGMLMAKTEAMEELRNMTEKNMAQKRRAAKEKLDLEIFNHYFLDFSGNG